MKKVLIFSTAYLPLVGGAEVAVKEITDRLGDNFLFDLICARLKPELPCREKIGRINVYRVGGGWGRLDKFLLPWRGAALAGRLHKKNKYEIVWAIMASFGGLAALFFKNRFGSVPYLLTLQEGDSPEHIAARARWLGPYWRRMFSRADRLTAISRYLADFGRQNGAVAPIEIIPNGVASEKFRNASGQKIKARLNLGPDEKTVITVSRLVKKNGLIDLVRAVGLLPEKVRLVVVGEGAERAALEAEIRRLSLAPRVSLLGAVPPGEIPEYLAAGDVFVRPSLSEGLGNVFLEAMAAGVPVIGTPVGGIPDFLFDGETGLFCRPGQPEDLAEKIKRLLNDEALRQKLIANGRALVSEKYSWPEIAGRLAAVFDGLKI